MITIEQVKKAFGEVYDNYDEVDKSSNFIHSHSDYYYSDLLDYHRDMIHKLGLSFWIGEMFLSDETSETLVYVKTDNDKLIHVLDEGINEFETLEDYVIWLNEIEYKANLKSKQVF